MAVGWGGGMGIENSCSQRRSLGSDSHQAGEAHGRSALNPATLSGSQTDPGDLGIPGCWLMRDQLSTIQTYSSEPAL